jgi:hypothetical protein
MNAERTGLWLRQTEHNRGHLWHRYSVTVKQVTVVTINFRNDYFNLHTKNPWFSSFFVSTNHPGNHERNHKLWNVGSPERYILHMNHKLWNVGSPERYILHMNHKLWNVGSPERYILHMNHKLWNVESPERYILHIQMLLGGCYIKI